jgi:cobalt-precorrin 5A hydrolase
MIAVGLGCRKGCAGADVVRAVETALASAGRTLADVHAFYAPDFKADESAIRETAHQLGKPVVWVRLEALQLQAAHALTQSAQVALRFGLPSIAETAALAGACTLAASPASRPTLLGPRHIAGGASCALAVAHPSSTSGDSQ